MLKKRFTYTTPENPAAALDDTPRGQLLTRKQALAAMAGAGAIILAGSRVARAETVKSTPCVALPAMTEGPFFVDARLDRADIRVEPDTGEITPGLPLELRLNVSKLVGGNCEPFSGAMVDLWHCDAFGSYSGVQDRRGDTSDKLFLRGYQFTNANGEVKFTTIYPGWYQGRAVHIHFKIRTTLADGKIMDFTSQFFFDDALSAKVYTQAPYAVHGPQSQTNDKDGIFQRGGDQLTLNVQEKDGKYAADFDIAVKMDAR